MAYADVLVTTKVNNFAGCYFRCCIAVSRKLPALVCYFTYCFQLAYVYSIGVSITCCYAGNLLVICVQTAAGDVCLIAITNTCSRHKGTASFYAVYGQVFLQFQTSVSNLKVVFACLHFYRNLIVCTANSNTIACCIGGVFSVDGILQSLICIFLIQLYIFTSNQSSVLACFYLKVFYLGVSFFQLTKVDCIGVISAICYAGNLLIICIQTAAGDVRLVSVAYALVFIHEEVASFYAVYSQIILQCYLNIFTVIGYFNISTIAVEFNFITSFANSHSSFCATICSKIPALIHYLLQLFFCSSLTICLSKSCICNGIITQTKDFSTLTVNTHRMLAIACYANYYAVFTKGSIVNLNISTIKADAACTCAFDRLHAGQIFADRNCIATINFDAIACSVSSIGICNGSCFAINSNGGSFV